MIETYRDFDPDEIGKSFADAMYLASGASDRAVDVTRVAWVTFPNRSFLTFGNGGILHRVYGHRVPYAPSREDVIARDWVVWAPS
jgi:hypothetical protein